MSLCEKKDDKIIKYNPDIMDMCKDMVKRIYENTHQNMNYNILGRILYKCYDNVEHIKKIKNYYDDVEDTHEYFNLIKNGNIINPVEYLKGEIDFSELTQLFILSQHIIKFGIEDTILKITQDDDESIET